MSEESDLTPNVEFRKLAGAAIGAMMAYLLSSGRLFAVIYVGVAALVLYYLADHFERQNTSMDAARLEAMLPGGRWDSVEEIPSVQAAAQIAERAADEERTSGHVCPDCGTDWGEVMRHDETMKLENLNYCPECGTELTTEETDG